MAKVTEPQRVTRIVQALEQQVRGDIFLRDLEHNIGQLSIERRGFGSEPGRPDALVWVELEMHILGVPVSLQQFQNWMGLIDSLPDVGIRVKVSRKSEQLGG